MDKGREVGAAGTTHIVEDPKKSYNVKVKYDDDIFDNILIKGDNLLVLMALEQDFADKVNCIYISTRLIIQATPLSTITTVLNIPSGLVLCAA